MYIHVPYAQKVIQIQSQKQKRFITCCTTIHPMSVEVSSKVSAKQLNTMDLEVSEVSSFYIHHFIKNQSLPLAFSGGLRYLRYGSLRGNILGVEAVLADGQARLTIWTDGRDASYCDVSIGLRTKEGKSRPSHVINGEFHIELAKMLRAICASRIDGW